MTSERDGGVTPEAHGAGVLPGAAGGGGLLEDDLARADVPGGHKMSADPRRGHDAEWPAARPVAGPVLLLTLLTAVPGLLTASAPQPPGLLTLAALGGEAGGPLVITSDQPP